jgi:hypothetical protein
MENKSSDPFLVHAWLSARSIARGLPAPVSDYGGYRVDTNSETEIQRWVFPAVTEGLFELAHSIVQPGYFVKICGTPDRLREVLPQGWQVHPAAYFMMGTGTSGKHRCPQGYTAEVKQTMAVTHVRIVSDTGELAASGYAAQTNVAFIYDRIVSAPEHRRKGLGSCSWIPCADSRPVSPRPNCWLQQRWAARCTKQWDGGPSLYFQRARSSPRRRPISHIHRRYIQNDSSLINRWENSVGENPVIRFVARLMCA